MNWKSVDSLLRQKLKQISKIHASPSTEGPKPKLEGLNSLLSDPILISLDSFVETSQDKTNEKRLLYTCFVCEGNFPSSTDEQLHNCEYDDNEKITLSSNKVSACTDTIIDTSMTSDLSRSSSEDSGISSLSEDSMNGSLSRDKSCHYRSESPSRGKKRQRNSSECKYELMPKQRRICHHANLCVC